MNAFNIVGKLDAVNEGHNGKKVALITTQSALGKEYLVGVQCWGKAADAAKLLTPGGLVEVSGYIATREYNGKYFTDAEAFSIRMLTTPKKPATPPPADDDLAF